MFNPNRIPTTTASEAQRRMTDAETVAVPLLVDVREPREFAVVRAEGAVLLPLSTFMLRYAALPKERPLLVICESGGRSAQATAFLLANGWQDVTNVMGGTLAWERAGLPVRYGPPEPGEGDLPG